MKRSPHPLKGSLTLFILIAALGCNAQNYTGNTFTARQSFRLYDWTINRLQRDTNFANHYSIPTALAIKQFVEGRLAGIGSGTGKLNISDTSSMLTNYKHWLQGYLKAADIAGKVNATDTAAMLSNYKHWLQGYLKAADIAGKVNATDTAAMLSNYKHWLQGYLKAADIAGKVNATDTATMLANYKHWLQGYLKAADIAGKLNKTDTAAMLAPYWRSIPRRGFLDDPVPSFDGDCYYDTIAHSLKINYNGVFFSTESIQNKSTDSALGSSNVLYVTQRAIRDYVLNHLKAYTLKTDSSSLYIGRNGLWKDGDTLKMNLVSPTDTGTVTPAMKANFDAAYTFSQWFNLVSPSNGSVIKYNSTSGKWEVGTDNSGTGGTFGGTDNVASENRIFNANNFLFKADSASGVSFTKKSGAGYGVGWILLDDNYGQAKYRNVTNTSNSSIYWGDGVADMSSTNGGKTSMVQSAGGQILIDADDSLFIDAPKVVFKGTASDPSVLTPGSFWYNTTSNLFKGRFGSTTRQLSTVDGTETFTNKTLTNPVIQYINRASGNYVLVPDITSAMSVHVSSSVPSSATPQPTGDAWENRYYITALATNATISAPSGTPGEGNTILIRIKDDGTSRTLTWNSIYRASTDFALPTATTISKTMYVQFVYNNADSKWDCVGLTNGF